MLKHYSTTRKFEGKLKYSHKDNFGCLLGDMTTTSKSKSTRLGVTCLETRCVRGARESHN